MDFDWIVQDVALTATAIDIFEKFHQEPFSVFLDSSNLHERYSFIARDPFLTFKNAQYADPFHELQKLLTRYKIPRHPGLPPFLSGMIGYFGYNLEDIQFGFYDTVLIIDHLLEKAMIASTGFPEMDPKLRSERAKARIAELQTLIQDITPAKLSKPPLGQGIIESNFTKKTYFNAVERVIEYIYAGDIFQANISQRFQCPLLEAPFSLYKRLRTINQAPFACYLNFPEMTIASSSPERFLLVKGNNVETRPIKGTRPRGHDHAADELLKNELWMSTKDRAELTMITDLSRNDLGRVCAFGTVKVPELFRLEEYPTVFHLVSTIIGKLDADKTTLDAIKAAFPGGSITGAPKIRAMEIIQEIEPHPRHIYTGSIGYIDFCEDADFNIAIRTFLIKDGIAYFNAGGGIVADSDPEQEYKETLHKAKALMRALGNDDY